MFTPSFDNFVYRPEHFKDIFETPQGQAIVRFVGVRDNVLQMITAADLGKASVEPLQAGLLAEFGEAVRADRLKRFIGHVVRQAMEFCSYQLDRQNVKIGKKILFKTGSRYAKREKA
jgi:hypothetical protein